MFKGLAAKDKVQQFEYFGNTFGLLIQILGHKNPLSDKK